MRIFKRFKKRKLKEDVYAKMGRLGVSPSYMIMYQDSIKKIEKQTRER